jgi:hypothetical protein
VILDEGETSLKIGDDKSEEDSEDDKEKINHSRLRFQSVQDRHNLPFEESLVQLEKQASSLCHLLWDQRLQPTREILKSDGGPSSPVANTNTDSIWTLTENARSVGLEAMAYPVLGLLVSATLTHGFMTMIPGSVLTIMTVSCCMGKKTWVVPVHTYFDRNFPSSSSNMLISYILMFRSLSSFISLEWAGPEISHRIQGKPSDCN